MATETYDLIVLGAGSAARHGAETAARKYGARIAMVENARWGGSCPNVACRPTKAYLVAAELLHDIRSHAAERGIDVSAPTLHLARTRAWKDSLLRDQASWLEVLRDAGYGVYPGEASFDDANTLRVGDTTLTAEKVLIATGGRTAVPPIPGIEDVEWIDHISALELTEVPESLLVVGAGPVGLEFAQIFARFGSRVMVVNQAAQIAARADADAAMELQAALEEEGLEFALNATVEHVAPGEAVVDGRTLEISHLLLASGRSPNVEALNLKAIGVEVGRGGILVDGRQRTSVPGIWAAGDVATGPWLTPTAQYQARIAISDMFGDGARTADYSALPTAIFTDPELGAVGMTEEEARASGYDVDIATHSLRAVTRAQYYGITHGLYKIVYDRSSRLVLGVHVVSREASNIVGALAVALGLGATVEDLAAVHHVYPSFSEGLKAAAEQAA